MLAASCVPWGVANNATSTAAPQSAAKIGPNNAVTRCPREAGPRGLKAPDSRISGTGIRST
jgi:hypothetical protein